MGNALERLWRSTSDLGSPKGGAQSTILRLRSGCGGLSRSLFGDDPGVNVAFQHIERQRSGKQHRIVEFSNIESFAELAPGAVAEFFDFQFADFVGERLAGHRNVTVDLIY